MKVLITGANGFVGSAIAAAFSARGHGVVSFVRPSADTSLLPSIVSIHHGEITAPRDIEDAIEKHKPDWIVHCAAVMSFRPNDKKLSYDVNVKATHSLLKIARKYHVKHVVYISSMSARPGNNSVYAATKRKAEELIKASGLRYSIIRPALVYGDDQRSVFGRLYKLLSGPVIPLINGGKTPVSLVSRDDLAVAALRCAERPVAAGKTYELGCREKWTFRELAEFLKKSEGFRGLIVPVPLPVMLFVARLAEALFADPPFTRDNVRGVATAKWPDIAPAQRDLDFAPVSFSEEWRKLRVAFDATTRNNKARGNR